MRLTAARVGVLACALAALGASTNSAPVLWLACAFGVVAAGAMASALWGAR